MVEGAEAHDIHGKPKGHRFVLLQSRKLRSSSAQWRGKRRALFTSYRKGNFS